MNDFRIGDPTSLDVDAVVNPLSITSTSKKGIGQRILEVGGKDLVKHLSGLERPKTGEARATPGFGIVAPTILHSVGPRYSENYITAAENALYGCYRSVMDYCVENRLKVIAIPPIHTIQRHFPPLQGAHIAIRSLRCLLQVRPNTALQRVILAFDPKEDAENIDIYHAVMKLYFPRTNEEEGAAKEFIPNLKCNEYGEVIVEERMVRINANFVAGRLSGFTQLHNSASSDGDRSDFSDSHSSAASSSTSSNLASKNGHFGENNTSREEDDNFPSSMRSSSANRDRERFSLSSSAKPYTRPSASSSSRSSAPVSTYSTTNNQAARAAIVESTYASYLAQANAADLTPVAQLEVFYPCGVDSFGRPVIAIVGARIPGISLHDLLFLHYIKFMDSYANAPYVLLYLHAGMNGKTKPDVTWFKKVHGLMDAKYGQSLVALHILHPTFWLKVVQKVTSVFISSTLVLDKIVYHDRIVDLVRTIGFTPKLPPSIVDFDIAENGPLPPSVTITP